MKEIMCTHLAKRQGVYYYRRKTPLALIEFFGKEVMKSLGTKERKLADALVRKMGVHYDELFANQAAKLFMAQVTSQSTLPPQPEIKTRPKYDFNLEVDDEEAYAFLFLKQLKVEREAALAKNEWSIFNSALNNLVADTEEYIKTGVHPFEYHPAPMWKLEAQIKAIKALREMRDLQHFHPSIPKVSTSTSRVLSNSHKLSAVIVKWALERKPALKTIDKMTRVINKFIEITGISDAAAITKTHCIAFKDGLFANGSTNANINQYLTVLNIALNFAVAQAIMETNPANGLKLKNRTSAKSARQSFDLPALNKIFNSPVYNFGHRPVGGKGEAAYWLPLLALFTGARLNELCQSLTNDVYEEEYHDDEGNKIQAWVLEVTNEGDDQDVKNDGSRRRIPIHHELIQIGFIQYVKSLQKGLIFPALTKSQSYDSLSANWSKWFSRYLRGIILVEDKRMVFHSFRHTFKDYCRDASIPSEVHNALTGHTSGNAADNYGSDKYPLRPLVEAMTRYKVTGFTRPKRANTT